MPTRPQEGKSGRPRNGAGGKTCSANQCKQAYAQKRQQNKQLMEICTAAGSEPDQLPENMWVNEINEILGERCCEPHMLSKKKRKNGPGSIYHQQFLVRGSFLENDHDAEEEEEDEAPEPNTFWVDQDALVRDVGKESVKKALRVRQERVIRGL